MSPTISTSISGNSSEFESRVTTIGSNPCLTRWAILKAIALQTLTDRRTAADRLPTSR